MTEPIPHASRQQLTAFSLGQLDGDEAALLEQHVSQCDLCCDTLLNLSSTQDTFVELLQNARHETPQDGVAAQAAGEIPTELVNHARYEVVELLGVGGMGNVYRAQHRMMERTVALKVINREMVNNTEVVERFRREVKAAAKLSHPNIVTAHDADQAGDVHFLVMECVDGTDLARIVKSRGPLSVREACEYVRQAATGLQHAHEQGMVHRDIKPHNLMLTPDGTVKILDFGLAALSEVPIDHGGVTVVGRADLTAVGTVMGTPDYISPEQATDARSVDGRSDIYSLGATFYFLLAGRPPFDEGSVMEKLTSHAESQAEPVDSIRDDIPSAVADVIGRMLAKDPAQRFQSAAELADALQPFVEEHATKRTTTATHKSQGRNRTTGWHVAVAALLLAAAALGIAIRVATNKGTLVFNSPDKNVEVVIGQDDTSFDERSIKGPKIVELPSGEYLIGLRDKDSGFLLDKDTFVLTRGSTATVTARLAQPAPTTPSSATKAINSMTFVLIPAGEFTMGTPFNRKATPTERAHQVTISTPFHIGTHEVTQEEYAWVMEVNPSSFCATGEHSESVANQNTDSFPVESVSWEDATEFCHRLSNLPESRSQGRVYRLPTEAEWELVCRAGTTTTFHFGDASNGTQANVNGEHPWGKNAQGPALECTTKTGSYGPNAFGVFDMHGNVREWCSDWYTPDYYVNSPPTDPTGPATGTSRVVRGGAWDSGAFYARASARDQRAPNYRDHSLGFRVVRVDGNSNDDSLREQTKKPRTD